MRHYQITPPVFSLPKQLAELGELAYNLWWSWNPEALRLFRRIDAVLWERTSHNPVRFLQQVARKNLNAAAQDNAYLESYRRVLAAFNEYIDADTTWTRSTYPKLNGHPIAYFSTEFGLHEALPMYAGGLGVLSGDHLKEASDLGLPLVAVGFLYRQGYFRQHITEDGWQEAINENLNLAESAILPVLDENKQPLTVQVIMPDRVVYARLWHIQVGRVPLFLIDTDVEGNSPADRELTTRLYYSDLERRLQQEMILGIGGVRALRALGYNPAVWHMNEGHSAFSSLERLNEFVEAGESFESALQKIRATTVFTTHTPVPAGHDMFPVWMMEKYFAHYWPKLGLDRDQFMALASEHQPWGEVFSMSLLAIKASERINGVSELHGQVSRKMFAHLWPDRPVDQVPITHITNGVHTGAWLARRMSLLFNRYLPTDWRTCIDDREVWDAVLEIPDGELLEVRRHLKRQLVSFARERARAMWTSGNARAVQIVAGGVLLDPYALTIGFARRFATYKRASLLLRDVKRLVRLVNDPARPLQIIFAGKAHPADDPGKHVIQDLYRFVKESALSGRIAFLEDYDMDVARHLVQGVDVWLNTPRRPLEASGTSGEKAGLNGVLNFSVLDGWWREGYNGENGWAIGGDADYDDPEAQDAADAEALFDTLEQSIVPLYYDVDSRTGIPTGWMRMVKESIRTLAPMFSTARMLKEYTTEMYVPAATGGPAKVSAAPQTMEPRRRGIVMTMPPLLAIGSAALDIKARLARAPLPTTDVPGRITLKPGGVARNIAENLARLGMPIVFAGITGDDPQARLLIELSRATGLSVYPLARSAPAPDDVSRLKLPAVLPTATLNVILGHDGRQIAGAFSGDILDALQPNDLDQLQELIDSAPAIICDGGLPADVLLRLRDMLPEEAFFYCNPGSVALTPRVIPLLDRLDLITCNHVEAQVLTQTKVDSPAKLISSTLILVKQGVRRAVVTFGARGLAYADEERSLYQPARSARLVDATGAGDALAAAMIEALLRDEPIGVCLQRGLAAAALTCESEDTVAPSMSPDAIQQRMKSTANERE